MSRLRFTVVVPAGGGKSTNTSDPFFTDIDELYHLKESESTYDRINSKLQHRAKCRERIPEHVSQELRRRIASYQGPSSCLLVHNIAVAQQTGLKLLAVFIPEGSLHETSIESRGDAGKWFARENRQTVLEECRRSSIKAQSYSAWCDFAGALEELRKTHDSASNHVANGDGRPVCCLDEGQDERHLLNLLTSAVGCPFEQKL